MRWEDLGEEHCSIARAMSVVGDRWTLMVLRESFLGVRRFEMFEERLGIGRPILSDRLRKLVNEGVLARVPYQDKPRRDEYRLTDKGRDLYPVILSLAHWADQYMAGSDGPPLLHVHKACNHVMHGVMTCSECGEPLAARDVWVVPGPGANFDGREPPSVVHGQAARASREQ
ncbi:winged helix-turn-helix transcriptional regulator [Zavarzinia sp. CC-PAN008]|uniref:winged helix-turn-helix transcriptional regulator n=1 Tax=Zavarzinia sp. CC-PAN008 TaxID=3243332 RepID=UPI003F74882D